MDKKSYILSNDKEVNKLASTLLLVVCLVVFPALIILTIADLFKINMQQLIIFTAISFFLVFLNFFLARTKFSPVFVKYLSIFISTMIVGMLATNHNIGIYLTYLFASILSCLYYDRKLNLTAFILGVISLFVSQYLRLQSVNELSDFVPQFIGFAIEFLAMFLLVNLLMGRINKMFGLLADSEQQKQILNTLSTVSEKSRNSSDALFDSVNQFSAAIEQTTRANTDISNNAMSAVNNSKNNLQYVQSSSESIKAISND